MATWEELSFRVAQAQGMVSVQADCTNLEALVLMKERARLRDQSLKEIADGVVERRIWFTG
jgi:AmiR/NasT family two-component response regulator